MLGSTAVASIIAGTINTGKKYLFETMLIGASLMTLGTGLLTLVHEASDDAKALGFIAFVGLGFGSTVTAATRLVMVAVRLEDQGKFFREYLSCAPLFYADYTQLLRKAS
jgi:hypothetical protein